MATTSARKEKSLYVLATGEHYWLSTLSTNRSECWGHAKQYCRNPDDYKNELKRDGYKCVKVRVVPA